MSVQQGPSGYDPTLSITEQITLTTARIASLVSKGREGTTAIQSARQQLANLQAQQTNHQAAQAAAKAVLAAHAATNHGTTAAQPPRDVNE